MTRPGHLRARSHKLFPPAYADPCRLRLLPRRNCRTLRPDWHGAFVFQGASWQHRVRRRRRCPRISPRIGSATTRCPSAMENVFQRRHQIGFGGRETNVLELEAHYVVGSGQSRARSFIATLTGGSFSLPVSWYAERGGYWAMSPGYDQAGASRLQARHRRGLHVLSHGLPAFARGCLSRASARQARPRREDDREGPRFGEIAAGGHRLPALPRSRPGSRRCTESAATSKRVFVRL